MPIGLGCAIEELGRTALTGAAIVQRLTASVQTAFDGVSPRLSGFFEEHGATGKTLSPVARAACSLFEWGRPRLARLAKIRRCVTAPCDTRASSHQNPSVAEVTSRGLVDIDSAVANEGLPVDRVRLPHSNAIRERASASGVAVPSFGTASYSRRRLLWNVCLLQRRGAAAARREIESQTLREVLLERALISRGPLLAEALSRSASRLGENWTSSRLTRPTGQLLGALFLSKVCRLSKHGDNVVQ